MLIEIPSNSIPWLTKSPEAKQRRVFTQNRFPWGQLLDIISQGEAEVRAS